MQGKYKTKKCKKGVKSIKKAELGIQDVNTGTGAAIGSTIGQGLNLIPGVGTLASTIATPLLGMAGNAIENQFNQNKLKKLNQEIKFNENVAKTNSAITPDLTSFQAKQYQGGTKKVQPYKAKTKEEFDSRSKAYSDSLSKFESSPKIITRKINAEDKANFTKYKSKNWPIGYNEGKWSDWKKTKDGEERGRVDIPVYAKPKQPVLPPDEEPTFEAKKDTILDSSKGQYVQEIKSSDSRLANDKGYSKYKVKPKVAPKMSKGTKVIEIEGKKTPEIHTDKNFNVKNLGTTPHSKGGNKVVAEEGDVVFPTQNSPKKYNEIMNAIKTGNKFKLKQEQAKLPEDNSSKHPTGTRRLKAPSNTPVAESTKHDTAYNTLPSTYKKVIDSSKAQAPRVSDKFLARGRAINAAEDKAAFRNTLNAASYLRTIPTPITQGIGWGAALGGAYYDAKDIKESLDKGKTGEAVAQGVLSGMQLLPGSGLVNKVSNTALLPAKMAAKAARGKATLDGIKTLGEIGGIMSDKAQGDNDIKEAQFKYSKGTKEIKMKKDKYKLKKEQNKLPEDKSKYALGGTVGETEEERKARESIRANAPLSRLGSAFSNALSTVGTTEFTKPRQENKLYKDRFAYKSKYGDDLYQKKFGKSYEEDKANMFNSNSSVSPVTPNYSPLLKNPTANPYNLGAAGYIPNAGLPIEKKEQVKSGGKINKSSSKAWTNPNKEMSLGTQPNFMKTSDTTPVLPNKIESKDISLTPANADGSYGKGYTKGLPKADANSLMELAPIAYNIGQGLFGKSEKVNRREFNPQMEQYVDTSQPTRRAINEGYKANIANSRNLSAGLSSNARANSQAAANAKVAQVNGVDTQEYGKQLDVANRNTQTLNNAKLTNLGLQNQYDELDAQNRAVKSDALSRGIEGLGDLGARGSLNKNRLQVASLNANTINQLGSYGKDITTDGTQITGLDTGFNGRGSGIPATLWNTKTKNNKKNNSFGSLGVSLDSDDEQSKGNKGIQVNRKYKLKK
jgi:hypothetical protein